jgi:uncharacterized SAM-binding protein YcdF (DUF218 family)
MFFILSKVLSFLIQPLAWVVALLGLSLILLSKVRPNPLEDGNGARNQRLGLRLGFTALFFLFIAGWQGPAELALRQLETVYPSVADKGAELDHYAGLIILGGALDSGRLWTRPGQIALNSAAERMTASVSLLQQHPQFKIIFTGGEGELFGVGPKEADRAKLFFDSLMVPSDHVVYEALSRNTHENAVFSAQIPGVDTHQPWLLVTSAFHMPRSMAIFQRAGWNVTAYPVDYRAPEDIDWMSFELSGEKSAAKNWQLFLHEAFGLIAYRLTGKI